MRGKMEARFYKYNVYQAKCSHVIMIIVSNKTITIKEQNKIIYYIIIIITTFTVSVS